MTVLPISEDVTVTVFVYEFQIGRQERRGLLPGQPERGEPGGRGGHQLPQGEEGLLGAVQAHVRQQEVIAFCPISSLNLVAFARILVKFK